jgi:hypothetical protein
MSATLVLTVKGDGTLAVKELEKVKEGARKSMSAAKEEVNKLDDAIGKVRKNVVGFAASFVSLQALSGIFKSIIANVSEADSAMRQTEARVRATGGAAGFTAGQLAAMASQLQSVTTYGDEAILTAETLLLTFKNVRGDTFQRTTAAILDMASAMGSDLQSAAFQVGKALQDPVRGAQLLQRAGVQLSASQKEMVKDFTKSGEIVKAQNVILDALEERYKGAAAAARDTFAGALASLKNAFGDLLEGDGASIPGLKAALEEVIKVLQSDEVKRGFAELVNGVLRALPSLISGLSGVASGIAAIGPHLGVIIPLLKTGVTIGLAYVGVFRVLPAIYAAAEVAAWRLAAAATATNAGLLASIKNVGILKSAFGVLAAAFAGWQIGTMLREQFLEVRLFGIAMIEGLLVGWERLKQGAAIAWEGIKAVVVPIINGIKVEFGKFIADVVDGIEKMQALLGVDSESGKSLVASMRGFSEELMSSADSSTSFSDAVAKINADTDAAIASIKTVTGDMAEYEISADAAAKATDGAAEAAATAAPEFDVLAEETGLTNDQMKELKTTLAGIQTVLLQQAKVLGDDVTNAALDYASAMVQIQTLEESLIDLGKLDAATQRDLAIAREQAHKIFQQNLAAIERRLPADRKLLADMDEEISLLRMSAREGRVEEQVRRAINDAIAEKKPLSTEQIARLREEVAARLDVIDTLTANRAAIDDWNSLVESGSAQAADAFGEFAVEVLSDFDNIEGAFENFGDSLIDMAKRTVAQLISEFMRLSIINPLFNQILGTALPTGGGMLGNLTGMGSGAASFLPLAAAAAGGLYGFTNRGRSNGSGGSLAGAAAYGGLAYAGGTIALGAATGASLASAAGGTAIGGAVSGGVGAAAALGPVAIALAVAAIIDMISGGKLFGTRYRAEDSGTTLSVGPQGGDASAYLSEVRQRSLFRGRQWRTTSVDPGDEARQAASDLFNSINDVMVRAAQSLKTEAPEMIEAAIRTVTEYDKKGKVKATKIFVDVIGRTWEEATADLAATRIAAEGIIKTIDTVMGGVATEVAERWRGDAEALMDGARLMLAASVDIREGASLLGEGSSLTQVVDFVEDMARAGEPLVDTYTRLVTATRLLEDATGLLGVTMDLNRQEFVEFAADIADAAGGIDEASRLWNRFFNGFFSQSELLSRQVERLGAASSNQLTALGLDPDITLREFREAFTAAMPTLTDDEIVQWLRAGDALLAFTEVSEQYANSLGVATDEVSGLGTDFYRAMRYIIDSGNAAAEAATEAGAGEARLAWIHMQTARQVSAAIDILQQRTRDLIARLYGGVPGSLDAINARIAELEGSGRDLGDGVGGVTRATDNLFARWQRGLENIQKFLDSMLLNTQLTTLTPEQQMREAAAQYASALTAARGGDATALENLPQLAQQYLTLARSFFSSGDDYTAIFEQIRDDLRSVSGVTLPGGELGGPNTVQLVPSDELRQLYAARDAATVQQDAINRTLLAMDLSANLRDLAGALDISVLQLAEDMGVNLQMLASDLGVNLEDLNAQSVEALAAMASGLGISLEELTDALGISLVDLGSGVAELAASVGINLEELTAESALGLAELAQGLGVDLSELATSLGVDLGDLADKQSLMNDALEGAINSLPEEQRDRLRPLLAAVEDAVTEADANAALAALEAEVSDLAPALRNALAPYFDNIDPSSADPDVQELMEANDWLRQLLAATRDVAAAIRRENAPAPATATPPGYAGGASMVTRDGLATIHAGEMVIDPETASDLRRYGIEVRGGDGAVVAELRTLRSTMVARGVGTTRGEDDIKRKLDELLREAAVSNKLMRDWMLRDGSGRR